MVFEQYPPKWRAEDHFRKTYFPDLSPQFLWRVNQGFKLPNEWFKKKYKPKAAYNDELKYWSHMMKLESTFGPGDSTLPFEVRFENAEVGVGVFLKSDRKIISKDEFNIKNYCDLFKGCTDVRCRKVNSHSQILVNIRRVGVGYKKKKSSKKQKRDKAVRNLYGPLSFINHACLCHAHLVIDQDDNDSVLPKTNKDFGDQSLKEYSDRRCGPDVEWFDKNFLQPNQELFLYYGDDYPGLKCSVCAKEKLKLEQAKEELEVAETLLGLRRSKRLKNK